MATFQTLRGFRDFYPDDCALRNYVFETWRDAAMRYGFVEYEAAPVEPTDLYRRKSGDEVVGQLFQFETRGGEDVALRPEVTPSLARMVGARIRDFPKPVKWFQIGQCFRYEKPQKGRGREFYQWNVDILGEASPEADAELVALAIDCMRSFGLGPGDFSIRISDRRIWDGFASARGLSGQAFGEFLRVIDKWEKVPQEKLAPLLDSVGVSYEEVTEFMADPRVLEEALVPVRASLEARGMGAFLQADPTIVRGLAYYTGLVFEVFDLKGDLRAVAGGGRYDGLVKLVDGKSDVPAAGFAMGDMVVGLLIAQVAEAAAQLGASVPPQADVFVVVGDEPQRPQALALVQQLREAGVRTDVALSEAKFGKQCALAEARGARVAVIVGRDFPRVRVRNMATREDFEVADGDVLDAVVSRLC
jgi:histidyl-tRNA synthetase